MSGVNLYALHPGSKGSGRQTVVFSHAVFGRFYLARVHKSQLCGQDRHSSPPILTGRPSLAVRTEENENFVLKLQLGRSLGQTSVFPAIQKKTTTGTKETSI